MGGIDGKAPNPVTGGVGQLDNSARVDMHLIQLTRSRTIGAKDERF